MLTDLLRGGNYRFVQNCLNILHYEFGSVPALFLWGNGAQISNFFAKPAAANLMQISESWLKSTNDNHFHLYNAGGKTFQIA
jgi:hypothetical protein